MSCHFFFEGFDHPIYTDLGLTSSSDHGPASLYIHPVFAFYNYVPEVWAGDIPVFLGPVTFLIYQFSRYCLGVIHSSMVQPPTNARYYPSNPKMVWWLNSKQLDGKIMLGNWYEQSIFFLMVTCKIQLLDGNISFSGIVDTLWWTNIAMENGYL